MKTTCVATLMSLPVAILAAGTQFCEVTTTANCRACPYDDDVYCPSIYTLYTGFYYEFTCRTIGGEVDGDDGWDYTPIDNCYVWEVLTDDNCAPSALPAC